MVMSWIWTGIVLISILCALVLGNGSALARDITEDDAQAWLETISGQRSWQAAENARKAAAALYKYGRARRVVTNNPFANIDMLDGNNTAMQSHHRLEAETRRTLIGKGAATVEHDSRPRPVVHRLRVAQNGC